MLLWGILLFSQVVASHASSCGTTPIKPSLEAFIIGGVEARANSIPWQISLSGTFRNFDEGHICGGSIISERYIISAAHCFFPAGGMYGREWPPKMTYYIRAGIHSLKKKKYAPAQKIEVEEVIVHEGYEPQDGMRDDIALLKLKKPLKFSKQVQPICLPPAKHSWSEKQSYLVTGWGAFGANKDFPDRLRQVIVPHFNNKKCGKQPNYGGGAIHDKVICAGYDKGGKDACEGDSGGPLATLLDDKWTLAGVVSWGVGCGGAHSPGVYTNTAMYIDWIHKHMK